MRLKARHISLLTVLASLFWSFSAAHGSSWPMFQHDAQHTGRSTLQGPQAATRQWGFVFDNVTNSGFLETPVVGSDGTIYIGSGTQSTGNLYAITPAGTLKWKSPGLGASPTTPAIGPDGTIYVGTEDFGTVLYALNPLDGSIRSTFPIGDLVSFITLGPNGILYVIPETGGLFALNPDVSQKWHLDLSGPRGILTPPVASDGTLYVVQSTLTAFNPDGSLKWISTAGGGTNAASIGSDGMIYLIWTQAPKLSAVAPSGNLLWDAFIDTAVCGTYDVFVFGTSMPAIAPDGGIILGFRAIMGSGSGTVQAFNPDGSTRWTFCPQTPGHVIQAGPIVDADGTIYFATQSGGPTVNSLGTLYALNSNGTLKWMTPLGDVVGTGLALGPTGSLYVTTRDEQGFKLVSLGSISAPTHLPVVLIHGIGGNCNSFGQMSDVLQRRGIESVQCFAYDSRFANTLITIEDIASEFGAYIRSLIRQLQGTNQVDVIAHSMGGLIVRAWMAGEINAAVPYNGEIRRLVLIATPNYGADGAKLGVVANVFGLPTSLLKEMNFSSEFIAGLDEKWQEAQLDPKRRIDSENLLLIAGTVGTTPVPGLSCSECDGLVEVASAALPDISLNNIRYVPYKHAEPILPPNAPTVIDNKSLNPDKHGTYTFVSEFLTTGTILPQYSIDYNPGMLSNALLFVVPFDQGTGQKLSGGIVRLTFRLPGGLNVNPQPQIQTNSDAGVATAWDVDTRLNPYIVNVQVPSYCSRDVQISPPAAVPTVLNVTFVPRALVRNCP